MSDADAESKVSAGIPAGGWRRFAFAEDTFAFPNELYWEYRFDAASGRTQFQKRIPVPDYAHRCFVLVRAARQFLYHAQFEPGMSAVDDAEYRRSIRAIVRRNPRRPCPAERRIRLPGFANLRAFSAARAALLKAGCGGAWRSYVLRSHWRMVFPISRSHQERTAEGLSNAVSSGRSPIVHLVRFPQLTINHGMLLFGQRRMAGCVEFEAYDPNIPEHPSVLRFDAATRTFELPANHYWAGGCLDVIQVYRSWWF